MVMSVREECGVMKIRKGVLRVIVRKRFTSKRYDMNE